MKKNPSWAFLSAPSFVALQRSSSRSDLCSVNVNPACPRLIQMFYSVISHKDASRNQRYSSISHSHKHESSSSSPPRPCPPPLLAACRLLAINAHFTYSSTPLALICVALDILHAGSNSTLLFYPVWSTDGLHGPKREDLVFQVFSSGSRGDQGRILGRARPLAACSQKD